MNKYIIFSIFIILLFIIFNLINNKKIDPTEKEFIFIENKDNKIIQHDFKNPLIENKKESYFEASGTGNRGFIKFNWIGKKINDNFYLNLKFSKKDIMIYNCDKDNYDLKEPIAGNHFQGKNEDCYLKPPLQPKIITTLFDFVFLEKSVKLTEVKIRNDTYKIIKSNYISLSSKNKDGLEISSKYIIELKKLDHVILDIIELDKNEWKINWYDENESIKFKILKSS